MLVLIQQTWFTKYNALKVHKIHDHSYPQILAFYVQRFWVL